MAQFFIGVDAGISGAIAIIREGGYLVELLPTPALGGFVDCDTLYNKIKMFDTRRMIACIEKAQAMPKQGVCAMFNYGASFGAVIGVIATICPYWLVPPKTWQKTMFEGTPADLGTKERSALAAKRLFPGEPFLKTERCRKIDSGMTDATLIAEYCRRTHGGDR